MPRPVTALKLLVLVAIVTWLLRSADLEKIAEGIGRIPLKVFAAGLVLTLTSLCLQAVRWRLLLKDAGIPFREYLAFIGVGASLNLVAPSSALSDGAVSYWMGKRNADVLQAMSTLFAAKLIGTVSAVVLFLCALASHLWVFERMPLEWSPAKLAFAGVALAAALAALLIARRHRERLAAVGRRALPAFRSPGTLALVLLLSLGLQAVQYTVYCLGFRAVGAPVALFDVFFFAPLVTFMAMIPISIGGLGVREGFQIFFYTLIPGVAKEMVLAQAGYNYLLLLGAAVINLGFAAAVLGLPGREAALDKSAHAPRAAGA